MDDRPARRHRCGHQPAVARHLQRRERVAGSGARRRHRRPVRGVRDAGGVRPAPQGDARGARRPSRASPARFRRAPSTASPTSPGCSAARSAAAPPHTSAELAAARPRRGRGRGGARARPSARPAPSGCPTRWATTTSPRASVAWPRCSARAILSLRAPGRRGQWMAPALRRTASAAGSFLKARGHLRGGGHLSRRWR